MKTILATIAAVLVAGQASAYCTTLGSESLAVTSCSDGNSFTTTRMGDMTFTNGRNSRTGSTWRQNTTDAEGWTSYSGRDSNGNSWGGTLFDNDVWVGR